MWTKALFLHKKQHDALNSQVKALTKKKKEKENVLTYLELINPKNVSLLQYEEFKRKTTKVKKIKINGGRKGIS
jgi:hypothetical protein